MITARYETKTGKIVLVNDWALIARLELEDAITLSTDLFAIFKDIASDNTTPTHNFEGDVHADVNDAGPRVA